MNIRPFREKSPRIAESVYVDPASTIIGDVEIAADSSIWPTAVIRGDVHFIKIGPACSIQDGAVLHVTHDGPYTHGGRPLILGTGITVGHRAVLHACTIEDYCLIGMGALLLDDVYVEDHVLIAAGSVVAPKKRLLSRHLYRGSPAECIRPLKPEEITQLEYSAQHYVRLKDQYLHK